MFIRLFTYSTNEEEYKKILNEIINKEIQFIDKIEYVTFEPYWKLDDIYKVEVNLNLKEKLSEERIKKIFDSISDKWMYFGDPIEEALASETMEGCNYIKDGVNMIDIFFYCR